MEKWLKYLTVLSLLLAVSVAGGVCKADAAGFGCGQSRRGRPYISGLNAGVLRRFLDNCIRSDADGWTTCQGNSSYDDTAFAKTACFPRRTFLEITGWGMVLRYH